jgi:hypothetical protein
MKKEYFLASFVLIMAAALLVAGCAAPPNTTPPVPTLPTTTPAAMAPPVIAATPVTQPAAPSWHMIKNETITIPQDNYHYFGWDLQSGQSIKFEVVTDGAPLDLTILDSKNFDNFKRYNGSETTEALKHYKGMTNIQDVYTASYPDTFFLVFDNFNDPGGSYAGRDVHVHVRFYRDY